LCIPWEDENGKELWGAAILSIPSMRDTTELWIWSVEKWPRCWPKRRRGREKEGWKQPPRKARVKVARPRWVEEYSTALQRQNAENLKQIFPEKEYRGLSPNFHILVSVSELCIPAMGLPFLLEEICGPILGIYKSLTDT
jgi:hypothetical protein